MKTTMSINPANYTAHLHPGKFEGETAATEYFHEQMLNGDGETIYVDYDNEFNDGPVGETFHVNADEAEAFSLPIGAIFMICGDSQGFVYGSVHATRAEAEAKFNEWLA